MRLVRNKFFILFLLTFFLLIGFLTLDVYQYLYPGAFRYLFSKEQTSPPLGTEVIIIKTADNVSLRVWKRQQVKSDAPTILVFGGDDGDVRYQEGIAQYFFQKGLSVITFDYRGFGASSGFPSQTGIEKDVEALITLFKAVPQQNRYVFGISFGTYPALYAATKIQIEKLILVAPFIDFPSVDRTYYHYPWIVDLIWPEYSNEKLIYRIVGDPRINIVYGDSDILIPPAQSLSLEQQARSVGLKVKASKISNANHMTVMSKIVQSTNVLE
jgi:hypothetical protein